MFVMPAPDRLLSMEIRISLDANDPPQGRLTVVHDDRVEDHQTTADPIDFAGWLELLRALSQVTGTPPAE
jgi:hypothetical protein